MINIFWRINLNCLIEYRECLSNFFMQKRWYFLTNTKFRVISKKFALVNKSWKIDFIAKRQVRGRVLVFQFMSVRFPCASRYLFTILEVFRFMPLQAGFLFWPKFFILSLGEPSKNISLTMREEVFPFIWILDGELFEYRKYEDE